MRVAEPGTVITPPSASPPSAERAPDAQSGTDSDEASEDGDTGLSAEPEFDAKQCLFCAAESSTMDDSLAHMSKAHSFAVPFPEHLTVDLETLLRYLHLVVYGNGECILCAARRRTVEGIQQHMTAKGHCRFEVVSEVAGFYNLPAPGYHVDEESLRLPSGKLLGHRTRGAGPAAPTRTARQAAERRPESTAASMLATSSRAPEPSPAQEEDAAPTSSTQLSRLARGDQQSLASLPDHEVRSLLATTARHIDQSRREEKDAQLRLAEAGNTTLMAHFRADTSKRFRGPWG